jgi:hypothetical protein
MPKMYLNSHMASKHVIEKAKECQFTQLLES